MLTWHASRAMLPLVGRIASDVVRHQERLGRLRPEMAALEEKRLALAWPQRARRYQLEEEIAAAEAESRAAAAELDALGVALLDPAAGLVGFPTLVNQRRAYFTWRPGEETLAWWSYAGDRQRRPVPEDWTEEPREQRPRRSRSRKK
jgi:hypothetical protein